MPVGLTFDKAALWDPYSREQTHKVVICLMNMNSALQFLVSPYIGTLSDRYGRRPVLLATMVGNILSAVMYGVPQDNRMALMPLADGCNLPLGPRTSSHEPLED